MTIFTQEPVQTTENQEKEDLSNKKSLLRIGLKEEVEETENKSSNNNNFQNERAEPFTEEQLLKVWGDFANGLTDKHLKSIILYLNPVLKENETIEIQALNPEQFQYIQQNSGIITEYLFYQLKNDRLKLEIKINEDNKQNTPFTAQEKYTYMVDKNPLLNKLAQEFNLRLD